jgi:hypothetical protein
MRILGVGAEAVGAYFGGRLAQAGGASPFSFVQDEPSESRAQDGFVALRAALVD